MDNNKTALPGQTAALFAQARFGGPTRLKTINPTVTTTTMRILGNNPKRVFWLLMNLSANIGVLGWDQDLSTTKGILLAPSGGFASMDVQEDGEGVAWEVLGMNQVAAGVWYGYEIERVERDTQIAMRTGNVLTSRLDWYDRNPVARCSTYGAGTGGIAPHVYTVRWTYTVPAGKKFALQAGQVQAQRVTAAGVASLFGIQLEYSAATGPNTNTYASFGYTNTPGVSYGIPLPPGLICLPGDILQCASYDASTAGTVAYLCTIQGIEFDA